MAGLKSVGIDAQVEFLLEHGLADGADGQMDVAAGGQQRFQQPHGVRYAACAGDGYYDICAMVTLSSPRTA